MGIVEMCKELVKCLKFKNVALSSPPNADPAMGLW